MNSGTLVDSSFPVLSRAWQLHVSLMCVTQVEAPILNRGLTEGKFFYKLVE